MKRTANMRTSSILLIWFVAVSLTFLFSACQKESSAFKIKDLEHVFVIGVDGMSPDGIRNARTPVIDELVQDGAATFRARGVLPTSSSPNWASMIMGAGPEQHGITSNAWQKDDFTLPSAVVDETGYFPTIFSIIRRQEPNAEIGAIYDWEGFGRLFSHEHVNFHKAPETEEATIEEAIKYVREKKPRFCFIHLDHVDHAGHSQGHGSPPYYRSVEKADSLIGDFISILKEERLLEKSLILLTADHGGLGFGHGGETAEEIEIPFILYGKGVKKGYNINSQVNTYDNAVTIAFALGLETPQTWVGRPVKEAFEGMPAPSLTYKARELLRQPVVEPVNEGFEAPGGLFIDTFPSLTINNPNEKGEIRFTLDGSSPDQSSPVFEKPVELKKNAVVKAAIFADGAPASKEETGYFRIISSGQIMGVNYACYEGENMDKLPDFNQLEAVSKGETYEFSLASINLPREEQVAVVFESQIEVSQGGEYTFYLASDDGSKLYVNDRQVVDNDGDHGVIERAGNIQLTPGKHRLKVAWYNGGGGKELYAFYKGPDIPKQIIPANVLVK